MPVINVNLTLYSGGRLFISKKAVTRLTKQYDVLRLRVDGEDIALNVRSEGRIQIPAKVVRKLRLHKGKNEINIIDPRKLPQEKKVQIKRRNWKDEQHAGVIIEKIYDLQLVIKNGGSEMFADAYSKEQIEYDITRFVNQQWKKYYKQYPYAYASLWGYFDNNMPENQWRLFTKVYEDDLYGNEKINTELKRMIKKIYNLDNNAMINESGIFEFLEYHEVVFLWKVRIVFRKIRGMKYDTYTQEDREYPNLKSLFSI